MVNALLAAVIERNPPDTLAGAMYNRTNDDGSPVVPDWDRQDNYQFGTGTIWDLPPYEKLNIVDAARPTAEFDRFSFTCVKHIGMGLRIPPEIVQMLYQNNYSASRAAFNDFYETCQIYMDSFENDFLQPLGEEFQYEMIAKGFHQANGYLDDPDTHKAYSGMYWTGRTRGSIDPTKDVKAAVDAMNGLISTPQIEAASLGRDFNDMMVQWAEAKQIMDKLGVTPNMFATMLGAMSGGEERAEGEDMKKEVKDD